MTPNEWLLAAYLIPALMSILVCLKGTWLQGVLRLNELIKMLLVTLAPIVNLVFIVFVVLEWMQDHMYIVIWRRKTD